MKLLTVSVILLGVLLAPSCLKTPETTDLYGSWYGNYHGQNLMFEFREDGTCALRFADPDSGETNEFCGTFEMDNSKAPVPLSIRNIPGLNHGLYTIVEFTGNGSLMMADFSPRWRLRPISFQKDSVMRLTRQPR